MTRDDWMRVQNPWRILEAAARNDVARDVAVTRIIDTMLEIQMECRHENPGYQPFSITGNVPMPSAGKVVDSTGIAAERMRKESEWHKLCEWLLGRLPRRQAAAMLLQAARIRPDKDGSSQWMVTSKQMIERQELLIRSLNMADGVRVFESVEALQKCARRARNLLRLWLTEDQAKQEAC